MYSIYLITNSVNDKVYVGITKNTVKYRFAQHISYAKRGDIITGLVSAMRIYGTEAFEVKLIEEIADQETAYQREIFWIEHYGSYKSGYNMTKGGEVGFEGAKSAEHRQRIGDANRGNKRPDLAELNRQRTGFSLSRPHKEKVRNAQFVWLSCLRCKTKVSKIEFMRKHNTNRHFGLPHGNTGKRHSKGV